jgi:cyclic-di-AMP phosphodiesterase PgpH
MAREYGLPRILHEFIGSHHGTTLVQYFYQAAAEQRKAEADRAPDEVEFRYPGPKPRSKEAAILMLADASESSVRAMTERTPGKIENQVHTMVTRRLMDGQLDECELTLREVHQIEVSLIKNLTSMYHLRIAYPTPPGQKPSAGELQAAARKEQESTNGKTSPQGK